MKNQRGFISRIIGDLVVGCTTLGAFVAASHWENGATFIAILCAVLLAVAVAGYLEPSAKRVWIHPLLIMWPEIIALPVAVLTCRGFECGGMIGFLIFVNLFTLGLVGLSFAVFYVRRWITRSSGT
jgi:hypothetical protein